MIIQGEIPEPIGQNLSDASEWFLAGWLSQLEPDRGVAVLIDGTPVALFKVRNGCSEDIYGVAHIDPRTNSPTIARGLVGSEKNEPVVVSPLLKDRFSLASGLCHNDPNLCLDVFDVMVSDALVYVRPNVTAEKQD